MPHMPSTYKLPHPDARNPEANRRKYRGKELLPEGALNEHDFEASRLTPLGSFSQPDPLASKYPWLSPYAYCAADPVNSIDPTGLTLHFNGDKEILDEALDILNTALGQKALSIEEGQVKINDDIQTEKFSEQQKNLFSTLKRVISSERIDVTLNIVNDDDNIYVGDASTSTFDLHDAQTVASYELTTTHSMITHEIYEQYRWKQLSNAKAKKPLAQAHMDSIMRESLINGKSYFVKGHEGKLVEPYSHQFTDKGFMIVIDNVVDITVHYIDIKTGSYTKENMKRPITD